MSNEAKPWEVHQAEFVKSATRRGQFPDDGLPQVAFAGRSNCGKSSLLNCLTRRKRLAHTSSTPGHTQLVNFFAINGGVRYFVNLPGYGFAKAPPRVQKEWRKMIEAYLVNNASLRLVVVLLDCRRKPGEHDDQLVEFLNHHEIAVQLLMTKCDKLGTNALIKARKAIAAHYGLPDELPPIATSAQTGRGREQALRMIDEFCQPEE